MKIHSCLNVCCTTSKMVLLGGCCYNTFSEVCFFACLNPQAGDTVGLNNNCIVLHGCRTVVDLLLKHALLHPGLAKLTLSEGKTLYWVGLISKKNTVSFEVRGTTMVTVKKLLLLAKYCWIFHSSLDSLPRDTGIWHYFFLSLSGGK